jgi:hypothetical protein
MTIGIRSNQTNRAAALSGSPAASPAEYLKAYKSIASAAEKLGPKATMQKFEKLGPAPDAIWKDRAALGQMSEALHGMADKFGNAIATQLPADTAKGVLERNPNARTHYTFKEQALMFDVAVAQSQKDVPAQQYFARELLKQYPDNAMADFYKGLAGQTGWRAK